MKNYETPITWHIDLLQIRNGIIFILDYKPDAHLKQVQEQAIQQLTIYALALSRKLNLPLYYFKTAWFDENCACLHTSVLGCFQHPETCGTKYHTLLYGNVQLVCRNALTRTYIFISISFSSFLLQTFYFIFQITSLRF